MRSGSESPPAPEWLAAYQWPPLALPRGMSTQFDTEAGCPARDSTFLDPAPIAAFLAAFTALTTVAVVVLALIGVP